MMSMPRDGLWDELLVLGIEKDRSELRSSTSDVIHLQCDEISFPVRPFAFALLFAATKAPIVRLCANNQDKISPVQSVEHPAGPAFGRCPSNVLIELGIDAVGTESLGQL